MNPRIIEIMSNLQFLRKEAVIIKSAISEIELRHDERHKNELKPIHEAFVHAQDRLLSNPTPSVVGSYRKAKADLEQINNEFSNFAEERKAFVEKKQTNTKQQDALYEELERLIDAGEFR